jgi:hypothetical protein
MFMKLFGACIALSALAFAHSAGAGEPSCVAELGKKQSQALVGWCTNVSPATRPPCNAKNACSLIIDEIKRGCALLENDKKPPHYCRLTYQNAAK